MGMSMDLYVFVDHPSTLRVIEWQQAIDSAHYPVRLSEGIDLRKLDGFLPVTLNTKRRSRMIGAGGEFDAGRGG
jgi:hypothetical protein